jgi:hypothetical protein
MTVLASGDSVPYQPVYTIFAVCDIRQEQITGSFIPASDLLYIALIARRLSGRCAYVIVARA